MQQQIQNREPISLSKPLTPIEQLQIEKIQLEARCRIQEERLNESFDYIRANTFSLLVSGLSFLFFNSGQAKNKSEKQAVAVIDQDKQTQDSAFLSSDNLLMLAKSFTPIVWTIVKPMLIKWGINKAKAMILNIFDKKNPKSPAGPVSRA